MDDLHENNGIEIISLEDVKKRYYPAVLGRISKQIRHDMDADILASKCFERVINYKKPINNIGGFLFRIADNIVRDEFRKPQPVDFIDRQVNFVNIDDKEGRTSFELPDPRPWKPEDQEREQSEREDREDKIDRQHAVLHDYLNELPPWKYQIYVWRAFDGESFDVISERIGMERDKVAYHFNLISGNVTYNVRKRYSTALAAKNEG